MSCARRVAAVLAGAIAMAAVAACGGGDGDGGEGGAVPTPVAPNLLANAGFEDGSAGWESLTSAEWEPRHYIATDRQHGGERAAYLKMHPDETIGPVRIYGVMQEAAPAAFPEVITGYYRVENWRRETPKQYMQVVVVVFDAQNRPQRSFPNHQIRYILNGIGEPPFEIGNAQYIYKSTGEPEQGTWVPFRLDIAADFAQVWGAVPEGFDKMRLLFEVRFDGKAPGERPYADVYFDDLYMGPASGAP